MIKQIKFFLLTSILISSFEGYAQYNPSAAFPEIGKAMPDFTLRNIKYYTKKQATLNDFHGRWLILDFWNRNCSGCIESLPQINAVQRKFKGQIQIVQICKVLPKKYDGGDEETLYAKYKKLEHLDLACAFDSLIAQRFNITGFPHVIIIDPSGIVRSITNYIHENDIEDFLAGKQPRLELSYTGNEKIDKVKFYDRSLPFLINGNGGADTSFSYRAIITHFKDTAGLGPDAKMYEQLRQTPGRIDGINLTLYQLYYFAFTGSLSPRLFGDRDYQEYYRTAILKIRDTDAFTDQSARNDRNKYCFSLTMPPSRYADQNLARFKTALQNELKNNFGYKATLETTEMPYLKLVSISKNKDALLTKAQKDSVNHGNFSSVSYFNVPVDRIIDCFDYGHIKGPVLIDETGIMGNIDIKLDVPYNAPWADIRTELRKHGLDLVEDKRPMKVLVIRDPEADSIVQPLKVSGAELPAGLLDAMKYDDDTARVADFITRNNINTFYKEGKERFTLLNKAMAYNAWKCVYLLIKKGTDVNLYGDGYLPPLFRAGVNLNLIKLLVEKGADIHMPVHPLYIDKFSPDALHLFYRPLEGETLLNYHRRINAGWDHVSGVGASEAVIRYLESIEKDN